MSTSSVPPSEELPAFPGRIEMVAPPPISASEVRVLSALDKVAIWFAAAILFIVAVIIAMIVWEWYMAAPSLRGLPVAEQAAAISNFKELSSALSERAERFFDLTVTKGLLPIFATLIGYLLGKQRTSS